MNSSRYSDILQRIEGALEATRGVFARFTPGEIEAEYNPVHADVPNTCFRIFRYVDVPGAKIPTGIVVTPLRDWQRQKVDVARVNNVLEYRAGLYESRFERLELPLLGNSYEGPSSGSMIQTKSKLDCGDIAQSVCKYLLAWITPDVLEQKRRFELSGNSTDLKFPVGCFFDSHQASGLAGANLDNGDTETLLFSMTRFFKFLPEEQRQAFLEGLSKNVS